MTTPFPFQSGATLLASQLNAITTLPINDQTASYTLLVGDVGKRVIMNVASANTVTVNNNVFAAGDTVQIINKGAGATTVTAGAGVTINSASGLVLPQYQSGQLVALSASSFLFFESDVTVSASGLTLISSTTIGSGVSSHAVSDVFSATYDAYKITVTGGLSSAAVTDIGLQLGATTTGYYMYAVRVTSAGAFAGTALNGTTSFTRAGSGDPDGLNMTVDVLSPFLSKQTQYFGPYIIGTTSESMGMGMGWLDNTTSYTGFTLVFSGGTATGGVCRVYGYQNS